MIYHLESHCNFYNTRAIRRMVMFLHLPPDFVQKVPNGLHANQPQNAPIICIALRLARIHGVSGEFLEGQKMGFRPRNMF